MIIFVLLSVTPICSRSWQMDESVVGCIQYGQFDWPEVNLPAIVVSLPETDRFTGERFAEINLVTIPA